MVRNEKSTPSFGKSLLDRVTSRWGWYKKLLILTLALGTGWTVLAVFSLIWSIRQQNESAKALALAEARFRLVTGEGVRAWAESTNGEFVPFLDTVSISPHSMNSLRHNLPHFFAPSNSTAEIDSEEIDPEWSAAIDSGLGSLNEGSAPDAWERSVLPAMIHGAHETSEFTTIGSTPYLRLMRPIGVWDGCLNCHVRTEFGAGEAMGGVSVAVSTKPFLDVAHKHSLQIATWTLVFWLLGILGLTGSFRAVSARERRNRKDYNSLALSETRLREAQRIAQIGSWTADLMTGSIEWSDEMYRIYGIRPGTHPNCETINSRVHPDDRAKVDEDWQKIVKGEPVETEARLLVEGRVIWVRRMASAKKDASGTVVSLSGTTQEITERKKAIEDLRASEERLALALSGADLGTWDWDIKTDQVTFDHRWTEMLGYEQREVDQTLAAWEGLIHPEDVSRVRQTLQDHLRGTTSQYEAEYRLRHKSGEWTCVLDKGRVIQRDSEGRPVRVCGTLLNITERKHAEHAKDEEALRRRILLEQSKDGIVIVGEKGEVIEANRSFADMLGYSPEELPSLHVWDWDKQWSRENLHTMIGPGESARRQFETRFFTKQGDSLDIDISANGAVLDGQKLIFCVCRDISERKRAAETLAVSLSLLRATLESTADGILVVDAKGQVSTMNRRFVQMWHIPDEIAAGRDDRELLNAVLSQLSDPDEFLGRVKQLYEAPLEESFDVLHFKDGRVFERYSTPQRLGDRVAGRVWSFRDVSARVRAEEEREQLREQYFQAQKMEAIGQLAGGVAHDFNNLLQIMLGYTECAKEEELTPDRQKSSLDQVETAIQQARGLVGQLLTFSRRKTLNIERFELDSAVADLVKMVRRLIGENIELVFKPGAPHCRIEADRVLIEQVILNLCVNARDAMSDGGTLTIETECGRACKKECKEGETQGHLLMRISDTGCGMDEETLNHIFEPFFTTKGIGKGTGLGLASAFGAIQQHKGSIEVHSRPGEGTRFDIHLPIADCNIVEKPIIVRGAVEGGQETILVAEDDDVIRKLTERILTRAGYSVILATDGQEAVEMFSKHADEIDLLVLDLMMPKKGGHEVYKAAQELRPGVPALFASGFSKEAVSLNLDESHSTALIQKPYRREILLKSIREVLAQRTDSDRPKAPASTSNPISS